MGQMAARGWTEAKDGAAPEFARGSDLLERAYALARQAHASQRMRDRDAPFIGHPVTVAGLLHEAGFAEELVAAALLHDVVENSSVESAEVEERICPEVARLVAALSENPEIDDYEERKRALRDQVEGDGERAAAVYAADKLANLRETRRALERDPDRFRDRFPVPVEVRVKLWHGDLEMVERVAPGLPFLRALRYELEAFEDDLGALARRRG